MGTWLSRYLVLPGGYTFQNCIIQTPLRPAGKNDNQVPGGPSTHLAGADLFFSRAARCDTSARRAQPEPLSIPATYGFEF